MVLKMIDLDRVQSLNSRQNHIIPGTRTLKFHCYDGPAIRGLIILQLILGTEFSVTLTCHSSIAFFYNRVIISPWVFRYSNLHMVRPVSVLLYL
ncbi:hypothetical protein V1478_010531 [Vespula squamosa]|uniref:Uncharacterized protein n=1 Tax=Vespula squamosa TaxID=30214 RepID=A0ABD2AK88_VESSQ